MELKEGIQLGWYQILGPLGAGGMGEVYRARDTRLGREVAIKILPEAYARSEEHRLRFDREARMLASLNHPNLAAIYGIEVEGETRYIVMELVEGDTLADLLDRGPLTAAQTLTIARQIAEALESAHEKGIVHRDLKPSNIKITPEGRVKVLDLGLAKMSELRADVVDLSHSPTFVLEQTRPGVIMGTAEFMSPEQARGKPLDKRSDVWSFGCIVFEMLTGRRAFTGETVSDIIAAILTREPDWGLLPAATPGRLRELLGQCLKKDRDQRLRDMGDARIEIERCISAAQPPTSRITFTPPRRLSRAAGIAAGIAVLAAAGWAGWRFLRPGLEAVPREKNLAVLPFRDLSGQPGGQLLGDGMVETVSTRLGRLPGVRVVPPNASFAAAARRADPFQAAEEVGASLLLRGAVQRSGDRLRVTYTLWNARTRSQVAADALDGTSAELFAIQDRLAESVAAALKIRGAPAPFSSPRGLETGEEQELYIQAIGLLQRYDKPASVRQATAILRSLEARKPEVAAVQSALARALLAGFNLNYDRRLAEEAVRACSRAESLDPESPEVALTVGEIRLGTGEPREAIAAFRRTLASQPENFDAQIGLARSEDAAGLLPDAEAAYHRALELQPAYFGGYSKLGGFYFGRGRYREAAAMFRKVTALAPDSAIGYSNLGAAEELLGDFDDAIAAFRRAIQIESTDVAYSNLGTLQFFLGRPAEAADAFRRAVTLTPNHYELWSNLGDACRWAPGMASKSVEAYDRAIELAEGDLRLNPGEANAHSKLALCLVKRGRSAEATPHMGRALALDPNNPEILYDAAVVADLQGDSAEALRWLARAAKAGYSRAFMAREPEFGNLRKEEAFQKLVRDVPGKAS
jgi:serine/threonine protein kinase/tetratricopeptide (TPR) repeat protein